ncbi:MAG: AsmA-like C-terminal region-containing protein [Myxococcota bacterium]
MKRPSLLRLVAGLALALALVLCGRVAMVAWATEPERIGHAFGAFVRAEAKLDLDFEAAERRLWPPGVVLTGVHAEAGGSRLDADRVGLGFSLLSLLRGEASVDAVDVDGFTLVLATDANDRPTFPTPDLGEDAGSVSAAAGAPGWVITAARLREGRVRAGAWQVEQLEARVGLGWDLSVGVRASAALPGRGSVRAFEWTQGGLFREATHWQAAVDFADVRLDAWRSWLSEPLRDGLGLGGEATGAIELEGDGDTWRARGGEVRFTGVHLAGTSGSLDGDATLALGRAGGGSLDLGSARLALGDWLTKPAGEALRIHVAPTSESEDPAATLAVASDPLAGDLRVRWAEAGAELSDVSVALELTALRAWWRGPGAPRDGRVRLTRAAASDPFQVHLEAARVSTPTPAPEAQPLTATWNGVLAFASGRLTTDGVEAEFAGGVARVSGHGDTRNGDYALQVETRSLDIGRLLTALQGRPGLEGFLDLELALAGRLEERPSGAGHFDLRDGRVPDAAFPWPDEAIDTRTAHGDEGERFDHLTGRFRLEPTRLALDAVSFEHPYASLYLAGTIALPDGALDLAGDLVVREELDAGLGGPGEDRTLVVEHIHGDWRDPQFVFDTEQTQPLFQAYAKAMAERLGREPGIVLRPREVSAEAGDPP